MRAFVLSWPVSIVLWSAVLLDCLLRVYIGFCGLGPDPTVMWSVPFLALLFLQEAYPGKHALLLFSIAAGGYLAIAALRIKGGSDVGAGSAYVVELALLAACAIRALGRRRPDDI